MIFTYPTTWQSHHSSISATTTHLMHSLEESLTVYDFKNTPLSCSITLFLVIYKISVKLKDKIRNLNQCHEQLLYICNEKDKYPNIKHQSLRIQITPQGLQQLQEIKRLYVDLHTICKPKQSPICSCCSCNM